MSEDANGKTGHDLGRRHRQELVALAVAAVIVIISMLVIGIVPRLNRNISLAQGVKQVKSHVPEVVIVKPKLVADSGLLLPGNIEAINETTINARTTGYLRRLYVDIGSHVTAGQVLAEIQAPDMDQQALQATAQSAQSRAVVRESNADVARQRVGVLQNQADADRQQATVEQARAQLDSAIAAVTQFQAASEGAESQLNHAQQSYDVQIALLNQQKAQFALAQVTYKRYKDLVSQGFDTQQDLDQANATLKTTEAQVVSAQASVRAAQSDIASAQKTVSASKSAVSAAQSNVDAARKNVQANIAALKASQAAVQFAKETVKVSQATLDASKASVSANMANEKRYSVIKRFQKVLSPFDGVVTARSVDVGALVIGDSSSSGGSGASATISNSSTAVAGSGMLAVARTDEVRIQVSVPQAFVPALQTTSDAVVTVRELPGREFKGIVALRSGAMDTVSRTQLVEVHLFNKDRALVPGMYAQVQITPSKPPRTLRVPGTALIVDSNGTRVGIVTKDKKVRMQPVVVGRDFGREVEILDGLRGRESLVNNPSDLLQDGDTVTISKVAPPATGGRGRGSDSGDETGPNSTGGGRAGRAGSRKLSTGKASTSGTVSDSLNSADSSADRPGNTVGGSESSHRHRNGTRSAEESAADGQSTTTPPAGGTGGGRPGG